jgi:outer membrane protein assembly factor BamB
MRSARRRLSLTAFALAGGLLAPALATGVASPTARQVYAPLWQSQVVELGPCLFTLAMPASIQEHCISWTRREASAPAFHRPTGILVIGGGDGLLHGISGLDGRKLYQVSVPGRLVAKPTLAEDAAFFGTTDGHVLRADVTSGRIRWDVAVDAEITEPVTLFGDLVLAVTGLDTVYAFDATSGESRWVHKHPLPSGITLRGQARPLATRVRVGDETQGRVFVGHASGRLSVLDPETGRLLDEWTLGAADVFMDVDADPILHGNTLVAASHASGVFGLDPATGATRWRLEETGIVRLATGGPDLVIAAGAGKVIGIHTGTGATRWRFTFERGAPTRPVVQGGRVHVASDRGALYVLDLLSGEPLQYFGTGLGFAGDLELHQDMLFLMSTAGRVYALSNGFRGRLQSKGPPTTRRTRF